MAKKIKAAANMYRVSLSTACQKSLSYHIMSLNSMYTIENILLLGPWEDLIYRRDDSKS